MKVFSTGLIVLLVAIIGGVIGGVCVCAYFYQDGKRKRRIGPMETTTKVVEPFNTKKLWERTRKKPVTLTNANSASTDVENGGVNPSPSLPDPGEATKSIPIEAEPSTSVPVQVS